MYDLEMFEIAAFNIYQLATICQIISTEIISLQPSIDNW